MSRFAQKMDDHLKNGIVYLKKKIYFLLENSSFGGIVLVNDKISG
jgi:hypothetical protein